MEQRKALGMGAQLSGQRAKKKGLSRAISVPLNSTLARGDDMRGTELVGFCRGVVVTVLGAAGTRKLQRHPIAFKPEDISLHSKVTFHEAHSPEKQPGEQRPPNAHGSPWPGGIWGGFECPAAPSGLLKKLQQPRLALGARAAWCRPSASAKPVGGGFPVQGQCTPHKRLHPTFSEV